MSNSRKVQRRIDKYLAKVGRALEHIEPGERCEILEGLRTHIHEELAQQGSTPPSVEDVRAVLSSMDVPQAYRGEATRGGSTRSARSRTIGRLGFFFFLGGIGAFVISLVLGIWIADAWLRGGLILTVVLLLSALGLGIAGWRDPYGKAAVIGAAAALIAAVSFFPVNQTASGPKDPEVVVGVLDETSENTAP